MAVILRALLVVGAMTYFALPKPGSDPGTATRPRMPVASAVATTQTSALTAAWNSLPTGTQDQIAREGAAEVARRFTAAKPSQDTLGSSDRKPAWRGALE